MAESGDPFTHRVLQPLFRDDPSGMRAESREGAGRMIAADRSGPGAEQLRNDAEAARGGDGGVEGRHGRPDRVPPRGRRRRTLPSGRIGQVPGVRGHDHRTVRADRLQQRPDHGDRPAAHPAESAQRRVDQHDHPLAYSERLEIRRQRRLGIGLGAGSRDRLLLAHRPPIAGSPIGSSGFSDSSRPRLNEHAVPAIPAALARDDAVGFHSVPAPTPVSFFHSTSST